MKQNKWYEYNQCNPTRSNQKSEARQTIDNEVINKKTEIDNNIDATIEEKSRKIKSRRSCSRSKNNINHTEINQAVDQAKEDGVTTVSHIQPNIVKKKQQRLQSMK